MEVLGKTCFSVDVVFHYLRAVICIQISYQLSLDPCWEFEVDKQHLLINMSALFWFLAVPLHTVEIAWLPRGTRQGHCLHWNEWDDFPRWERNTVGIGWYLKSMSESRRPLARERCQGFWHWFSSKIWSLVDGWLCTLDLFVHWVFPSPQREVTTQHQLRWPVRDAPCHHQSPDVHRNLLFSPTYGFTLWALPFQKVGLRETLIDFIFILE